MPYRVKVSRRASNDVAAVAAWIAERSPDGARRWLAALDAVLEAITRNPDGYPCAEEDNDICEMELRQFLFKTRRGRVYRGVFTIVGEEVRVLRIPGPGQRPITSDDL